MKVRYWIEPDVSAAVSKDGGPFEPYTTYRDLLFDSPAEETADTFVFSDHGWRIRVAKADVWRYWWDGTQEHSERCG